jgi:WD40 repeat protein
MFSCLKSFIFLGLLESLIFRILQVSTHGCPQNHILVWKYPSLTQIANITSHSSRVLYLTVSPDGETVVTGGGDESVCLWNVFSKACSEKVSVHFIQWEKLFSNGSRFFNMTFILMEIYKKY